MSRLVSQISAPAAINCRPFGVPCRNNSRAKSTSEVMFAALTNPVIPSAIRRRTGCSRWRCRGNVNTSTTSSVPSKTGNSQNGPAVSRDGRAN